MKILALGASTNLFVGQTIKPFPHNGNETDGDEYVDPDSHLLQRQHINLFTRIRKLWCMINRDLHPIIFHHENEKCWMHQCWGSFRILWCCLMNRDGCGSKRGATLVRGSSTSLVKNLLNNLEKSQHLWKLPLQISSVWENDSFIKVCASF